MMNSGLNVTAAAIVLAFYSSGSAAVYTVTNVNDSGLGSLRAAVADANGISGVDSIVFAIGATGTQTIKLKSPLPEITDTLMIDGCTQPGYQGLPLIYLDGKEAGNTANGLHIQADGCEIKGLGIGNFASSGIFIDHADRNVLLANFIGTTADGLQAAGNGLGSEPIWWSPAGVLVVFGDDNKLGDGTTAGRNLISGNEWGVHIVGDGTFAESSGNRIEGNAIGTDLTGLIAIPNCMTVLPSGYWGPAGAGIHLNYCVKTTIRGNVISGNESPSKETWHSAIGVCGTAPETLLEGNLIGTDAHGQCALPNNHGANLYGDSVTVRNNVISGNLLFGIRLCGDHCLVEGNTIGLDLDGETPLGNGEYGLLMNPGDYALIRNNLVSCNGYRDSGYSFGYGIAVGSYSLVEGNLIGTDASGTKSFAWGNPGFTGVGLTLNGTDNIVGGTTPAARNVISGNCDNLWIASSGNRIVGNFIGPDITGLRSLHSRAGVVTYADANHIVSGNIIGGTQPGEGNVISANSFGVGFSGFNAYGNRLEGNLIGTDATGLAPLPNGQGVGVNYSAHDNMIGGKDPGMGNVIAYNGSGISIAWFDYELEWGPAPYPVNNSILGNSIHDNGWPDVLPGFGIWFPMTRSEWTIVQNDDQDADEGPNGLQNFPLITSASSTPDSTVVLGTLHSTPNTLFRIEFFANPGCDASRYGEGKAYLGFSDQTTDAQGTINFTAHLLAGAPVGSIITATATDPQGNTSPFSYCGTTPPVVSGDAAPPQIACPADVFVPCSTEPLVPVVFSVTATDAVDPAPVVTTTPEAGSDFPVGTTLVRCKATDASGNTAECSFNVIRAPLGFGGFLPPLGGADATGGSFANPLRTFKSGSTIPVKFTIACGGSPVSAGIHKLQVIKYSDATTVGDAIDATPRDAATIGNQFRFGDNQWHFNLDTRATGMTPGIWLLLVSLSDGSQHAAWIQVK